jgi:hypothetical protein
MIAFLYEPPPMLHPNLPTVKVNAAHTNDSCGSLVLSQHRGGVPARGLSAFAGAHFVLEKDNILTCAAVQQLHDSVILPGKRAGSAMARQRFLLPPVVG